MRPETQALQITINPAPDSGSDVVVVWVDTGANPRNAMNKDPEEKDGEVKDAGFQSIV